MMAWVNEHWWLWPILWAVVGLVSIRFTMWEQDKNGEWRKDPGFAIFIALTWPALLVIGAIVGAVWAVAKGISIPLYYWVTPAKVRKANGTGQFAKPAAIKTAA